MAGCRNEIVNAIARKSICMADSSLGQEVAVDHQCRAAVKVR